MSWTSRLNARDCTALVRPNGSLDGVGDAVAQIVRVGAGGRVRGVGIGQRLQQRRLESIGPRDGPGLILLDLTRLSADPSRHPVERSQVSAAVASRMSAVSDFAQGYHLGRPAPVAIPA